jgi:uncharacterized membrane protein
MHSCRCIFSFVLVCALVFYIVNKSHSKFEFESYLVCNSKKDLKIEKKISIFSGILG